VIYLKKWPRFAKRHSAFTRRHGITMDCDAIGIPNCGLGKPVGTARSSSAAKRTGRLNGTPGKKL